MKSTPNNTTACQVLLPDGWFPNGTERPMLKATVISESNGWARVQLEDGSEQTVPTKAFR